MNKSITINKVKYDSKKPSVHICYDLTREGVTDHLVLDSDETPSPEFVYSLEKLKDTCCEMLEVDADLACRVIPYGVSFTYDNKAEEAETVPTDTKPAELLDVDAGQE